MGVYFPEIHGLRTQPGGFLALSTNRGKENPSVVLFRLSRSCTYLKVKEVMNRRIMIENRLILRKENSSEVCFFYVYKAFVSKTPQLLFLIGMRREKGVRTVHILLSALQNLILKEKSQKVMFVSPLTQNICICSHSTALSDALV